MMSEDKSKRAERAWLLVYIAAVVTITLLMLGYQYARFGHL